ncbi:Lon protease [Candidatus Pantoea edessiphila]|uniref:endopeptidase La n=1 Tax=Candidatus Pantoea edessiphila TaxID=2044610 RepID=A0A2P5SZ44_9GAMM|nr:AAA family ATPase [Candidatus Pantoea edessiphila]MBK4775339.1 AAA family ATPase [Pantoea sp. Edef]PPI87611.1 Lon protease [Candidatus Pantoea edessiphila]
MNYKKLTWKDLQPDILRYRSVFSKIRENSVNPIEKIQPRLINGLAHIHHQKQGFPVLLICGKEDIDYLKIISQISKNFILPASEELFGGDYQVINDTIILKPASDVQHPFTSVGEVCFADWIEKHLLFGYACVYKNRIHLEPGLIHKANGGTLILSLKSILLQPEIWLYLKKFIKQGYSELFSQDKRRPLPISIPVMPLKLNLVLCGDIEALYDLQKIDSELYDIAIYTEFEKYIKIFSEDDMLSWCRWVVYLAEQKFLPIPKENFWPVLIKEGIRISQDKEKLPLCPVWLVRQIRESVLIMDKSLNDEALYNALQVRLWRENHFQETVIDDFYLKQNILETQGEVVGQINGLSVIDDPTHPRIIGYPCRITCVVYPGHNEFIDVEGNAKLGSSIYIKSMMIIQSYLMSEFDIQVPFVASLVFEQSYDEINGDSASLAILCALISSLSKYPINQQIAVTGSIDQLGKIQPVGALNEKIESFFEICYRRGLTGKQGVIIPYQNERNLGLNAKLIKAVQDNEFHIWTVQNVNEAVYLLTGKFWKNKEDKDNCLYYSIQKRIDQQSTQSNSSIFRWFKWFK